MPDLMASRLVSVHTVGEGFVDVHSHFTIAVLNKFSPSRQGIFAQIHEHIHVVMYEYCVVPKAGSKRQTPLGALLTARCDAN